MSWAGHVARIAEVRGVYRVSVGKPVGKSAGEDPGIDGRIISADGCGDWIGLAQDRDRLWAFVSAG
jgi:hypothetical protein